MFGLLDGGTGAALVPGVPLEPGESLRFGYPGKLATSVRGRLKRLQTGANPAELQLGHDCSAEQCTTLLGYLLDHRTLLVGDFGGRAGLVGQRNPVQNRARHRVDARVRNLAETLEGGRLQPWGMVRRKQFAKQGAILRHS